jgi:hypothetical protein
MDLAVGPGSIGSMVHKGPWVQLLYRQSSSRSWLSLTLNSIDYLLYSSLRIIIH